MSEGREMKRAMIAGYGMAALLGASSHRIADDVQVVAPTEPPKVDKYGTRQLRRAAEKRARKMAKRATRSRP